MAWIQIYTQVPKRYAEALSDALEAIGSLAVTLTDAADSPIFEPPIGSTPIWPDTRVTGLFEASRDTDTLLNLLASRWPQVAQFPVRAEALEDKDWVREWMDQFKPVRFGERLWVVPSWLAPPEPDAIHLLLDPGLAFGTGDHPTTALCLTWLSNHDLSGKTVIDFGCGSGILACAAAKLGAKRVIGTDIDPQAMHASAQNAQQNKVELELYLPDQMPAVKAEIVVANILFNPLKSLAPQLLTLVAPNGLLVMSGILIEQVEPLIAHYQALGTKLVSSTEQGDWAQVVLANAEG
ncbi:MAG: 50S ribosomal protein L11 methyltransferase [Gammaproteobacteria bacterium]|nr:50S ribosomal protein L11 methyltransferase [Gammaproteobacteria bacterium]